MEYSSQADRPCFDLSVTKFRFPGFAPSLTQLSFCDARQNMKCLFFFPCLYRMLIPFPSGELPVLFCMKPSDGLVPSRGAPSLPQDGRRFRVRCLICCPYHGNLSSILFFDSSVELWVSPQRASKNYIPEILFLRCISYKRRFIDTPFDRKLAIFHSEPPSPLRYEH